MNVDEISLFDINVDEISLFDINVYNCKIYNNLNNELEVIFKLKIKCKHHNDIYTTKTQYDFINLYNNLINDIRYTHIKINNKPKLLKKINAIHVLKYMKNINNFLDEITNNRELQFGIYITPKIQVFKRRVKITDLQYLSKYS